MDGVGLLVALNTTPTMLGLVMKPRLPLSLSLTRSYATRLPQKPPYRAPDPLVNNPHATYETLPGDLTLIHRPPPSAQPPESFSIAPASPLLRPATSVSVDASLPPQLFPRKRPEPPRMSDEDLAKMRQLRKEDPDTWVVSRLARKFNCTQTFVKLVAPLKPSQRKKKQAARDAEHARMREKWGERKALQNDIKQKRKEFW